MYLNDDLYRLLLDLAAIFARVDAVPLFFEQKAVLSKETARCRHNNNKYSNSG